jgi:hypothetical protein
MSRAVHPWELLIVAVAGWINRDQQAVIDYLVEENRVLKGQLRGRRLRLTDDDGLQSRGRPSAGNSSKKWPVSSRQTPSSLGTES